MTIAGEEGNKPVVIIGISGPSSSGKTTVVKNIINLLDCMIIHEDDFYVPDDQIPIDPIRKEQNWDHPDAINFERFQQCIEGVRNGKQLCKSLKSFEADIDLKLTQSEIDFFKECLLDKPKDVQIVLVDGFMLFHDEQIAKLFDLKLFYYSTYDCLKLRRSKRAGYSTVAGFWVDPPNYFDDFVWPAYEKYHNYLFIDNDVNKSLNDFAKNQMNIIEYKNDDTVNIKEMVSWTLDQILHYINGIQL